MTLSQSLLTALAIALTLIIFAGLYLIAAAVRFAAQCEADEDAREDCAQLHNLPAPVRSSFHGQVE
jgi:hypothetical protein